jgi:hypothetical protein
MSSDLTDCMGVNCDLLIPFDPQADVQRCPACRERARVADEIDARMLRAVRRLDDPMNYYGGQPFVRRA